MNRLREDLRYALERDWFGAPDDCIPKAIIQQILDASLDYDKFEVYTEKVDKKTVE